jgi:hypothetical protein
MNALQQRPARTSRQRFIRPITLAALVLVAAASAAVATVKTTDKGMSGG